MRLDILYSTEHWSDRKLFRIHKCRQWNVAGISHSHGYMKRQVQLSTNKWKTTGARNYLPCSTNEPQWHPESRCWQYGSLCRDLRSVEEQKQLARRVTYPESRRKMVRELKLEPALLSLSSAGTHQGHWACQWHEVQSFSLVADNPLSLNQCFCHWFSQQQQPQNHTLPFFLLTICLCTNSGINLAQREWRGVAPKATLPNTTLWCFIPCSGCSCQLHA